MSTLVVAWSQHGSVLEHFNADTPRLLRCVVCACAVMGEAMEELLGDDVDEDDLEMMKLLMKQKAPEKVVVEALARMRDLWMSEIVSDFFTRMAEGDKPPPVIYCHLVAQAVR